jgi:hypothetical protein
MSATNNGMTHQQKVDRLIADLGKRGVGPYTVAPPLFRLLWRLGINVPPPFFLRFLTILFFTGSYFAVFWGLAMWVIQWHRWHQPELALITAAGAGLFFGLFMATYYRWKAARLGLKLWENYPGAGG